MSEPATDLKELLIERGFDWAIRMSQPPELAESVYVARLDALSALMRERGIGESRPSIEMLQTLCKHSPFKADAFLEALVSIHGPEVLCAAWRVIQGMMIEYSFTQSAIYHRLAWHPTTLGNLVCLIISFSRSF